MNENPETTKELPFNPEKYTLKEILRPEHCALLVIDVQNDFIDPNGYFARVNKADVSMTQATVPHIQKLIDIAHKANVPVIFTRGCEDVSKRTGPGLRRAVKWVEEDGNGSVCTQSNTWGWEFYQVKPEPQDIVVDKNKWTAFDGKDESGKPLDDILKEKNIQTLVIVGVMTETCVNASVNDAFNRDYFVVVPKNSVGTNLPEQHRTVLEHLEPFLGDVVDDESVIEENWPSKS